MNEPKKSRFRSCLIIAVIVLALTCVFGAGTCGGCLYYADRQNEEKVQALLAALSTELQSHPRSAEHLAKLAALIALVEAGDLTMSANARLAGAYGVANRDGVLDDDEIDVIMEDVDEVIEHGGDVGPSSADFDFD